MDALKAPAVIVIDVPSATPPLEVGTILSEPYARGYHIHRALDHPDGARIVYVRDAPPKDKPVAAMEDVETRVRALYQKDRRISANAVRCVLASEGMRVGSDRATAALAKAKVAK